MKKLLLSVISAMTVASCATQQTIYRYREASGRNIEPAQNAVITPAVADLKITSDARVTHTEHFNELVTPEIIKQIDNFKKMALLNAANKYNADTMVAALINVDTDRNGYLVITVSGYPAKYVNFRVMKESDLWITNIGVAIRDIIKKDK